MNLREALAAPTRQEIFDLARKVGFELDQLPPTAQDAWLDKVQLLFDSFFTLRQQLADARLPAPRVKPVLEED